MATIRAGARNKPKQTPPPVPEGVDLLDLGRLLWSEELAAYLGVPVGTLDQWASKGGGPDFHKVGGYRRYAPRDVRAWLLTRRVERGDAA